MAKLRSIGHGLGRPGGSDEHDAERGGVCGIAKAAICRNERRRQLAHIPSSRCCRTRRTAARTVQRDDESATRGRNRGIGRRTATQVGPIVECERVPFRTLDRSAADHALRGIAERVWTSRSSCRRAGKTRNTLATSDLKDATVTLPEGYHDQPVARARVWARARPRSMRRKRRVAAGRRLPAGIEDRLDRNRNAAARRKDRRRGLYRHAIRQLRSANPATRTGRCWRCMSSRRTPQRGIIIKVAGQDRTEPRDRAAGHDVR